jgi:hypothetical protein
MNTALRARLTQFHWQCRHELLPLIQVDLGETLTAPLERLRGL